MHTHLEAYLHLVWPTWNRRFMVTEDIEARMHAFITDRCQQLRCAPIAVGGMPDHVHLLVALCPTVAIATLMKEIKSTSSRFATEMLGPDAGFRWARGYGAFTLRKSDVQVVRQYIQRQKEHHVADTLCTEWEPSYSNECVSNVPPDDDMPLYEAQFHMD